MPTTLRRATASCAATRCRWAGTDLSTTVTSTRCSTWMRATPTAGPPTSGISMRSGSVSARSSPRAIVSAARPAPAARAVAPSPDASGALRSRAVPYLLAAGALLGLTALAFAVGRYPVSLSELANLLLAKITGGSHAVPANVETVVMQVRGPRVLAALVVGAALAAAGTAYQGMFRNPLVSPDILGVSTGAALGAVLGIFLSLGVFFIQLLAFAGGLVAVGLVYFIGSRLRGHDLLLALVLT